MLRVGAGSARFARRAAGAGGVAAAGVYGYDRSSVAQTESDWKTPVAVAAVAGAAGLAYALSTPAEADRVAFWAHRWRTNSIGWHREEVHRHLRKYEAELGLVRGHGEDGARVLVPLCGATRDVAYLASMGHLVTGIEGVPQAVDRLFMEASDSLAEEETADAQTRRAYDITTMGKYDAETEPILLDAGAGRGSALVSIGDFFTFRRERSEAGQQFDACFDRGSLVAIEPAMRERYVAEMSALMAPGSRTLLCAVEHGPPFQAGAAQGPPFHVGGSDVEALYGKDFEVRRLEREDETSPRFQGVGKNTVYLLTRRG